nr:MAG TPA: DARPIN 44C12V5 SCAFFOLD, CYTOKINE-DE NOVO PROTEIN.6A [Caudoviricetes sp.]
MTVKELIEELKNVDEDYEVLVQHRDDGGFYYGYDDVDYIDIDTNKKQVIF